MRRISLVVLFVLLISGVSLAQKYAYVDSDYILENIPAYEAAQEQLDQLSEQYQKELETIYAEIEQMYQDYQSESVLLSDDMKRKREDVIITKEKEYKVLQKKYFGTDGDIFKKRQSLIEPIQDDIYNAIQDLAAEGNYVVIFDKAGGLTMLYTDPEYDLSDRILQKLGYKN